MSSEFAWMLYTPPSVDGTSLGWAVASRAAAAAALAPGAGVAAADAFCAWLTDSRSFSLSAKLGAAGVAAAAVGKMADGLTVTEGAAVG